MRTQASVVAHNDTIFAGSYSVSAELGDGTGVGGSLLVTDDNRLPY